MKLKILLLIFCHLINKLNAQKKCLIAVNTKDCQICLSAYKFVNKIDKSLNPYLILDNVDSSLAHYFVLEFLKVKNIPYEINKDKYNKLFSMGQVYLEYSENDEVLYKFKVKELAEKIEDLNNFALPKDSQINFFSQKNLDLINDSINKNKFFGTNGFFTCGEYYSIYSSLTKNILVSNLKSKVTKSFCLSDSLLLSFIYPNNSLDSILKSKRLFYLTDVGEIMESQLTSYAYYNDRLYIKFSLIDYAKMKTKIELLKSNNEVELAYRQFWIELGIVKTSLVPKRVVEIPIGDNAIRYACYFSVIDEKPALHCKKITNDNPKYYYTLLNQNYSLVEQPQVKSNYMCKIFEGNIFFHQYTYNLVKNILIDNNTSKSLKISKFGNDTAVFCDIKKYGDNVYLSIMNMISKTLLIYKINNYSNEFKLINSYSNMDTDFYFSSFYLESSRNLLHIIGVTSNKKGKLNLIDSIPLD